jgi:hypothetical protein
MKNRRHMVVVAEAVRHECRLICLLVRGKAVHQNSNMMNHLLMVVAEAVRQECNMTIHLHMVVDGAVLNAEVR